MRNPVSLSVLVLLLASPASNLRAEDKVTVLADPWCPFTCSPADQAGNGILVDIAELGLSEKNKKVVYTIMPWARAVDEVRAGKSDAVAGAYKSDAPDFLYTAKAMFESADCFYSTKESKFDFKGKASLMGKRVGIIQDYTYGEEIDSFKDTDDGKKIFQSVGGEKGVSQNTEKLLAGRIDYILENREVMAFNQGKNPKLAPIKRVFCFKNKGLYVGFSPAKPSSKLIVKELDAAMKGKGFEEKKRAILKKYSL